MFAVESCDGNAEINVCRLDIVLQRSNPYAVFCVFVSCTADAGVDADLSGGLALDVQNVVLDPESVDDRTLGSVEITVNESVGDSGILKLISLDHSESAETVSHGIITEYSHIS